MADWYAIEANGKKDGYAICENNSTNRVNRSSEGCGGEGAMIEDQDGNFDEGSSDSLQKKESPKGLAIHQLTRCHQLVARGTCHEVLSDI